MTLPLPERLPLDPPPGDPAAVDHLVRHLSGTAGRPLTGITPREAAERVAAVDLDRPLGEGPDALRESMAELSRLWLDDAIYHPGAAYIGALRLVRDGAPRLDVPLRITPRITPS